MIMTPEQTWIIMPDSITIFRYSDSNWLRLLVFLLKKFYPLQYWAPQNRNNIQPQQGRTALAWSVSH